MTEDEIKQRILERNQCDCNCGFTQINDAVKQLTIERDAARSGMETLNSDYESMLMESEAKRMREFVMAEKYKSALEKIARKAPHEVSINEAADMACEFKLLAQEALK